VKATVQVIVTDNYGTRIDVVTVVAKVQGAGTFASGSNTLTGTTHVGYLALNGAPTGQTISITVTDGAGASSTKTIVPLANLQADPNLNRLEFVLPSQGGGGGGAAPAPPSPTPTPTPWAPPESLGLQPAYNSQLSAPVTLKWTAQPGAESYSVFLEYFAPNSTSGQFVTDPNVKYPASTLSWTWDGKTTKDLLVASGSPLLPAGSTAPAGTYYWNVFFWAGNTSYKVGSSQFKLQ
jgi:hypothetical protein